MHNNLHEQWSSRDDKQMAKQPVSVRLPIHILARISAIADMYDTRKRSEVITELLNAGLEKYENDLEEASDGLRAKVLYRGMANTYYHALKVELGEEPKDLLFPEK